MSMTMLMASMGTSIANVGLPSLVDAFGASFQSVQWVVLSYLLAVTALIVSVGRLGDLCGRRKLLLAGIGLYALASIACGLAPALWILIVARAFQGLGAAVMMALSMAIVANAVPPVRAGSAMGLLGTMSAVGTALGPSLGGILLATTGWHGLFLINAPLGMLTLWLAWRFLPADRDRQQRTSFDYYGSLVLVMSLTAYAMSMTLGRGAYGMWNGVLLCLALAGAGLFVRVEARVESPLIRLDLFRNQVVGLGFATGSVATTVAMTTLVVGPFYLMDALHLRPVAVGLVMTTGPLVAAVAGVPAGRAVDSFGARRIALAGLLAMTAGCLGLAFISVNWRLWGYIVPLVLFTAGFAVFQAANNTGVMSTVSSDQRGVVSGLLNLSRNLGLITGASLMGAIYASGSAGGGIETSHNSIHGMHVVFGSAACLVACALALSLLHRVRANPHKLE